MALVVLLLVIILLLLLLLSCSALHVAVRKQDWGVVACLIKLGADPLQENNTFRNPLQLIALKVSIYYTVHGLCALCRKLKCQVSCDQIFCITCLCMYFLQGCSHLRK